MKRKLEFIGYFLVIIFFIGRYAVTDGDKSSARRPSPRSTEIITPERRVRHVAETTQPVLVEVEAKRGDGSGTAFSFDGRGQYITARHVVDGCTQVSLLTGPRKGSRVPQVLSESSSDFAVLNNTNIVAPRMKTSRILPRRGDEGFMMGYPQGKPADVRAVAFGTTRMTSRGRYDIREPVVAWIEKERRPHFTGSLGGMSGGPVFNARGEVVGTVVAGAPRRGRIYTTHPDNFYSVESLSDENQVVGDGMSAQITSDNFDQFGDLWRRQLSIAKVYCKSGIKARRR